MATYVAMVRGVNVGGRTKLANADLKQACAELGYTDLTTYVNSGNIVFTALETDADTLAAAITDGIAPHCAIAPPVLVRTAAQVAATLAGNPFLGDHTNPHDITNPPDITKLAVTFLSAAPASTDALDALGARVTPDEFHLSGQELYLHCPSGFGRTKLTNTAIEKALGVTGTARNWKTVTKLVELSTR